MSHLGKPSRMRPSIIFAIFCAPAASAFSGAECVFLLAFPMAGQIRTRAPRGGAGEVPQSLPTPPTIPPAGTSLSEPCPIFKPAVTDVLMYPTARHVPGPCWHIFYEGLGQLLSKVAQKPTWEAIHCLLVLPELVLQMSRHRGKAHQQQQLAIDVGRWLSMFGEGKYEQLWLAATSKPLARPPAQTKRFTAQSDCDLPPPSVAL